MIVSVTPDFQEVTFRNMNLGCSGLRALTPHFVKCLIQCLSLENCNLDDETLPYISSIIKVICNMIDSIQSNI